MLKIELEFIKNGMFYILVLYYTIHIVRDTLMAALLQSTYAGERGYIIFEVKKQLLC